MNSIAFKFNYDDYAIEMGTGNIFPTILEDYETLGVIGEEHNKLMCYLAATSCKEGMGLIRREQAGHAQTTMRRSLLKSRGN